MVVNWVVLGVAIIVGTMLVHGLIRGEFGTWRWLQKIRRDQRPVSYAIEVIIRAVVLLVCLGVAFPGPSRRLLRAVGLGWVTSSGG